MELNKIEDKLKQLKEQHEEKRQETISKLAQTKGKLLKIESDLITALNRGDIHEHTRLLESKKDLEEHINFYAEYLNNFDALPIINEEQAKDLLKDIEKLINEKVPKPYKEILKDAEKLNGMAKEYLDFYDSIINLTKCIYANGKMGAVSPRYLERDILHQLNTYLTNVIKHANKDDSYTSSLDAFK